MGRGSLRPESGRKKRDTQPYRYLAIRVRKPQGMLFGDGAGVKHFAVVSNDWRTEGQALLEWARGRAGTIELVNDVLKNDLAEGVYPSEKVGANAAWLRLQVLTYNLLELLKATALDTAYRRARPKRLRFAIFTQFGRVVQHAHHQFIRLTTQALATNGRLARAATGAGRRLARTMTTTPHRCRSP